MSAAAKPALRPEALMSPSQDSTLRFDRRTGSELFNRQPFLFAHNLNSLDLFKFDSLQILADKFSDSPRDYFIAGSSPAPGAEFYSVPNGGRKPVEALENLDRVSCRILLKRPEDHDSRYKDLLDTLFRQAVDLLGGLGRERVVRLESAILISSGSTTTPIHFDPEIGFFSQIEGEKFYHVYPPDCTSERALERFYIRGRVDIGNVDLGRLNPEKEVVFHLLPGMGFHQPQNSPHWVRTGGSRSVSYTFVFQTDVSRARDRTRAFNYCMRKLGVSPSQLGIAPMRDSAKARAIRAAVPVQFLGRVFNKAQRVLTGRKLS